MTQQEFLDAVKQNAKRVHGYEHGRYGSDGLCDCIGQIIGAVRMCGIKWPWTHGCNYAARNRINNLHYISSTSQLKEGDIIFKIRNPGDNGYDLPSSYDKSPDRKDYYHVGVVTSTSPFQITHCSKINGVGGIFVDTKLGAWHYAGELNLIEGEGEDKMEVNYKAKVVAESGNTVRMRKSSSQKADVVKSIPVQTIVTVVEEYNSEWAKIAIDGNTGYMMTKFLEKVDEADSVTITLPTDVAIALLNELQRSCLNGTDI